MLGSAICMVDRKTVFHRVFSDCIIAWIIDFFIYDCLDLRILGGVDLKSAGIYQIACLAFGVA